MKINQTIDFGFKFKEIREKYGGRKRLTQKQLAEILGESDSTIKYVEGGGLPKLELLIKMCQVLKLSLRYFVINRMTYEQGVKLCEAEKFFSLIELLPSEDASFITRFVSSHIKNISSKKTDLLIEDMLA